MARWPRSQRLTLTLTYRGGAESWWLVDARGHTGVFPGWAVLEDVMHQVMSEPDYAADDARSRMASPFAESWPGSTGPWPTDADMKR